VLKVQTQTNKKIKLGFKRKEQKETEENPGLVHRTVRCATGQCPVPRVVRLQTCHLRVSEAPLRHNSPDCPVCHQTARCTSGATASQRNGRLQRSPATWTVKNSARRSQSSHQRRTGLSGATWRQSSNGRNRQNPNGWVTCPSTATCPNSWIGGWGL
jgi:hypothetical protein